jgi:integrase
MATLQDTGQQTNPDIIAEMGVKQEFKNWVLGKDEHGKRQKDKSKKTFRTYWSLIKNYPAFNLKTESVKAISGRMYRIGEGDDNRTKSSDHYAALRQFVEFQYSQLKKDDQIDDAEIHAYRTKKNQLQETLSLDKDEKEREGENYVTVEEHYIEKDDFIELLRRVTPERAAFYAFTYYTGCRWGEIKRITPGHIRPDTGEHGGVRIEQSRSKSVFSRTVQFYTPPPMHLLEEYAAEARVGEWEDDNGEIGEDVIFPEVNQDKINYRLGKRMTRNGETKLYGTYAKITGEVRTIHSLRHTRITDLVESEQHSISEVRKRSGHRYTSTTDGYTDNDIENPRKLEDYCDENDIDILQVIKSTNTTR